MTAVEQLRTLAAAEGYVRGADFASAADSFADVARTYTRVAAEPGWVGVSARAASEAFERWARQAKLNTEVADRAARVVAEANAAIRDAVEEYGRLPSAHVPDEVVRLMNDGGSILISGIGVLTGANGLGFVANLLNLQQEAQARSVLAGLEERLGTLARQLAAIIDEIVVPADARPSTVPAFPLDRSEADLTPWELGVEWITGKGNDRTFIETDEFTQLLRSHPHYMRVRARLRADSSLRVGSEGDPDYRLDGLEGVGKYVADYSTLVTAGATGNLAVTYLGSHSVHWKVIGERPNGDLEVEFSVQNGSSLQSATRPPVVGYESWYRDSIGAATNLFSEASGIGLETTQTITWTETIER